MVSAKTKVCCIIADPVEHSLSPAMHNAAYAAAGLDWVYVPFQVKDLRAAVQGIRALGIRGSSVTIPHKVAVMEHLDELDPVAEWIGSVNTIINEDGRLVGTNTDGAGAMKALVDAGVELEGKRALILGSGGGARAVAITLGAKAGLGSLHILGVIEKELETLAADCRDKAGVETESDLLNERTLAAAMERAEVVIHCTPVGMHPKEGESVVSPGLWRADQAVMDIVYNPRETRLLKEAREAGCRTARGLDMLLNQGVLQYEAWTGEKAPVEAMRKALEEGLPG